MSLALFCVEQMFVDQIYLSRGIKSSNEISTGEPVERLLLAAKLLATYAGLLCWYFKTA